MGAYILGRKLTSKQDREYSLLYSDNIEQPNDKDEDEKNRSGEIVEDDSLGETPEGGTSSRKTPEGETSSEETSVKEGSKSDVETIQDETPGERKQT